MPLSYTGVSLHHGIDNIYKFLWVFDPFHIAPWTRHQNDNVIWAPSVAIKIILCMNVNPLLHRSMRALVHVDDLTLSYFIVRNYRSINQIKTTGGINQVNVDTTSTDGDMQATDPPLQLCQFKNWQIKGYTKESQ